MFSYMSYLHPVSAKLRQQTALSSSSPNIQNGQITRKLTKKFFRLSHPAEICERCLSCALISSGNCRSLLYYFPFSVSFIPDWQKHKSDCFPNPQNIHKYQPVWVPQPIPLFAPNGEVIRLSAEVQFNWNTKVMELVHWSKSCGFEFCMSRVDPHYNFTSCLSAAEKKRMKRWQNTDDVYWGVC